MWMWGLYYFSLLTRFHLLGTYFQYRLSMYIKLIRAAVDDQWSIAA